MNPGSIQGKNGILFSGAVFAIAPNAILDQKLLVPLLKGLRISIPSTTVHKRSSGPAEETRSNTGFI